MNTSRNRLRNLTLLAIPLILVVAARGGVQEKPDDPAKASGAPPAARGRYQVPRAGGEYGPLSYGGGTGAFGSSGRLTQGKNVMISWSKNNDELRGFSQKTGEWARLKIKNQTAIVPMVLVDVAVVRVGDTMAAYSGVTGSWDVLKLSEGSKAFPNIGANVVQTTDNDRLYTFAAATGKWTSPDDANFRRSSRSACRGRPR